MIASFSRLLIALMLSAPILFGLDKLTVGLHQPILINNIPKKDFMIGMSVFLKEFTDREGVKTDIRYYDDPLQMAEDFKSGRIDFVAAEALFFVEHIPQRDLQNGIMGYKHSKVDSQTLLVLEQKNDPRPLHEKLKGSIASDGDPTSELYLKTLMLENKLGHSPDLITTKNAHQCILKLFFGKADLAVVDKGSYLLALELNPQLETKLSVLKSVPLSIGPVSFMHARVPHDAQKSLILLGKKLNTTERGKQLLKLFTSSYIDESNVKDLDNVYALHAKYNRLLKTSKLSSKGIK